MSQSKRTGIPTVYNGIQFRSRLEARWACFFDLCGWNWQYEPSDLNGWIPDFLVSVYGMPSADKVRRLDPSEAFYVEVRPNDLQDGLVGKVTRAQDGRAWRNVLLIGEGPQPGDLWFDLAGLMIISTTLESGYLRKTHLAVIDENGLFDPPLREIAFDHGRPTLLQMGYAPDCLILNQDTNVTFMNRNGRDLLSDLWNMAGNKVQWKGAQNHG